jgi:hypothetical protein
MILYIASNFHYSKAVVQISLIPFAYVVRKFTYLAYFFHW